MKVLGLLLLLVSCDALEMARVAARYYAKEICSCLFVVGQTKEYCLKALENELITDYELDIDRTKKIVSSKVVFAKAKAEWLGPYKGCRLQ